MGIALKRDASCMGGGSFRRGNRSWVKALARVASPSCLLHHVEKGKKRWKGISRDRKGSVSAKVKKSPGFQIEEKLRLGRY